MLSKQSPHSIMQGLFTAAGALSPEGEKVILTLPGWLRFQAVQMRPPPTLSEGPTHSQGESAEVVSSLELRTRETNGSFSEAFLHFQDLLLRLHWFIMGQTPPVEHWLSPEQTPFAEVERGLNRVGEGATFPQLGHLCGHADAAREVSACPAVSTGTVR